MVQLKPHQSWPEVVFHVLAHVPSTVAASVYDPVYMAHVAQRCGAADERTLAEDAAAILHLAPSHEALAAVQLLAWSFASVAEARAVGEASLADIAQVPRVLRDSPAAELLWCAALLEIEVVSALGPVAVSEQELSAALARVAPACPALETCTLTVVRALRLRGRALGWSLWVGMPGLLGVTHEHVAWQAAHEATVAEVSREGARAERAVEREAVRRLAARADACGLRAQHRRWLDHFDPAVRAWLSDVPGR